QRLQQAMGGHEELGVAERLDGTNRHDDLFAGTLRGIQLPVQLPGVERGRRRLDTIPVRTQANHLKRIGEQATERLRPVQAEGFDLAWPEADPEQRRTASRDWQLPPPGGQRLRGSLQPEFHIRPRRNTRRAADRPRSRAERAGRSACRWRPADSDRRARPGPWPQRPFPGRAGGSALPGWRPGADHESSARRVAASAATWPAAPRTRAGRLGGSYS